MMQKEKSLKSKVNGNELDLSLSELSAVPVKEIASIKKIIVLDLSCNRLCNIQEEFCVHLVHIVKLDLSQNNLTSLPEQFGLLSNLCHLDLYKNKLTRLPLSFCQLVRLKWLDLKDNPLDDDLRKVCGDCLDETQCKRAACKVLDYMTLLAEEEEKRRSNLAKLAHQQEVQRKAAEDFEELRKKADKKKDRERKKQKHGQKQDSKTTASDEPDKDVANEVASRGRRTVKQLKLQSSWLGRAFSGFLSCAIAVAVVVALILLLLPQVCRTPSGTGRLDGVCARAYELLLSLNLSTESSVYKCVQNLGAAFWDLTSGVDFEHFWRQLVTQATAVWQQLTVVTLWIAGIVSQYISELAKFVMVVVLAVAEWLRSMGHGLQSLIENGPEAWEKVKYVWNNMK